MLFKNANFAFISTKTSKSKTIFYQQKGKHSLQQVQNGMNRDFVDAAVQDCYTMCVAVTYDLDGRDTSLSYIPCNLLLLPNNNHHHNHSLSLSLCFKRQNAQMCYHHYLREWMMTIKKKKLGKMCALHRLSAGRLQRCDLSGEKTLNIKRKITLGKRHFQRKRD